MVDERYTMASSSPVLLLLMVVHEQVPPSVDRLESW